MPRNFQYSVQLPCLCFLLQERHLDYECNTESIEITWYNYFLWDMYISKSFTKLNSSNTGKHFDHCTLKSILLLCINAFKTWCERCFCGEKNWTPISQQCSHRNVIRQLYWNRINFCIKNLCRLLSYYIYTASNM